MSENQPMYTGRVIVVGGINLSGKGTNAQLLHAKFPDYFAHQTTSGLLQAYSQAEMLMRAGKMVPDIIVYRAVQAYLNSLGCPKGLLADGWVRTVPQAERIFTLLSDAGYGDIRFVEFQVEDDVVLEARREERWKSQHRSDDEREVAWKRIDEYRERSAEVLEACKRAGFTVITIDASVELVQVQDQFALAVLE